MASSPSFPVDVFISYAHKDKSLLDQVVAHLSNLKQQGVIREWHGRKIFPGADWPKTIDEHLETAQVILLLISADFMASGYCHGIECKRALERRNAGQALVIPVMLRPVDLVNSPIAELQALPVDGIAITLWKRRDLAFVSVANGIREALSNWKISPPSTTVELTSPPPTTEETKPPPQANEEGLTVNLQGANHETGTTNGSPTKSVRVFNLAIISTLILLVIAYFLFVYNPAPAIRITVIPPFDEVGGTNSNSRIAGEVSGVAPNDLQVVIYSLTKKTWYVQPTIAESRTSIQPDGTWSANIHTGIRYAALLVRPSFKPLETTSSLTGMDGVVAITEVDGQKQLLTSR